MGIVSEMWYQIGYFNWKPCLVPQCIRPSEGLQTHECLGARPLKPPAQSLVTEQCWGLKHPLQPPQILYSSYHQGSCIVMHCWCGDKLPELVGHTTPSYSQLSCSPTQNILVPPALPCKWKSLLKSVYKVWKMWVLLRCAEIYARLKGSWRIRKIHTSKGTQ